MTIAAREGVVAFWQVCNTVIQALLLEEEGEEDWI